MTEVAQTTDLLIIADNSATKRKELLPAERAVLALGSSKAEAQIQEYLAEAKDVTTVTDKTGRELAHKVGMKLKNARTSIEKIGKAAREDAQAFSKAVIEEEKRLKGLMADEEDRVFKLRDSFDAKEKAEKEAKERAERERVEAIQKRIDAIGHIPSLSINDTAEEIESTLSDLKNFEITAEDFAELVSGAQIAKDHAIRALREMLLSAESREAAEAAVAEERARLAAESERLAAERAELERMRAEIEAAKAPKEEPKVEETPGQEDSNTGDLFADGVTKFRVSKEIAELSSQIAPEAASELGIGVDLSAGDDQTVITEIDADALVRELATYTSLQFQALSKKVAAVMGTDEGFAKDLAGIGEELARGGYNPAIKRADWTAMADADKEMALASHACVSLILGDEAMGGSVLREVAA